MVKSKFLPVLLLLMVAISGSAGGKVIINEVLVNEPGALTSLEWFELYNDATSDAYITFCQIRITSENGQTDVPLQSGNVPAGGYAVICRSIALFESYWGNGDGTWGNALIENYPLYERSEFSFTNDSGSAILSCVGLSSMSWPSAGDDGYSWERVHPESDRVLQSIDSLASTPGRVNSVIPEPFDLALLSAEAVPTDSGYTSFTFQITNEGLDPVGEDSLFLFYDPEKDSNVTRSDLIAVITIPETDPYDTIEVTAGFSFAGVYADLLAQLMSDDKNANNLILFNAPGADYPPAILSEFIPDPESPLATEWIELRNPTGSAYDIGEWYIGDETSLHLLAPDTLTITPYGYLVLCRDSLDFVDFYGEVSYRLVEMSSWPALNNNGDLVRLVDNYNFTADSIRYDSGFGGNISWARGEFSGYENRWGRSSDSGGTPGAENIVLYPSLSETIEISIDPDPFSVTWDGHTTISFSLPEGYMTMKLFDKRGREVKTLFDNFASFEGAVEWDGTDDDGRHLPIGIYILYVEVDGVGNARRTVVVAP